MSIDAKLQSIFREVFDNDTLVLTGDLSPKTFPDWDSFHQVKLVIAIEEEFGTKLSTEEAVSLTSVAQMRQWLRSRLMEADECTT
jgi:acyl carrier protein